MSKPKIEKRVVDLEQLTKEHDTRLSQHNEIIQKLDKDMEEVRQEIKLSAKKSDIESLRSHIDEKTILLLRDALSAVPQKAMVWWMAIAAVIALLAFALPWAFQHFGL